MVDRDLSRTRRIFEAARPLPRHSLRRRVVTALAASVSLMGVAVPLHALAHAGGMEGAHGLRQGHHAQGHHAQGDPAQMRQFMEQRLRKSLADVGANDVQQTQVLGIMRAAFDDLTPLRDQARATRRASADVLAAPTVDRGQLEVLRVRQIEIADQVSRRMSQAFADMADVLTPEQRARFAQRFQNRMHGWRSGVAG